MEMVYFTAANREDVLRIGKVLVEERLAACVNVLGGITSIYRWEGAVRQENEFAAIAKTSREKLAPLIERVKALHEYTCPCVVSWPITQGNPDYLQWVNSETQP